MVLKVARQLAEEGLKVKVVSPDEVGINLNEQEVGYLWVDEFVPLETGRFLTAQRKLGAVAVDMGTALHRAIEQTPHFVGELNTSRYWEETRRMICGFPSPKVRPREKWRPQYHNEERQEPGKRTVDHKQKAKARAAAKRAKKARRK